MKEQRRPVPEQLFVRNPSYERNKSVHSSVCGGTQTRTCGAMYDSTPSQLAVVCYVHGYHRLRLGPKKTLNEKHVQYLHVVFTWYIPLIRLKNNVSIKMNGL